MRILFALATLFSIVAVSQVAAQTCHLREIDLCAATLLLFNQGPSSIPTSGKDIDRQCGHIKEAFQCAGNYSQKCMTPLQKEFIKFIAAGASDNLADFCNEGGELRNKFLAQAPCLKEAYGEARKCLEGVQNSIDFMSKVDKSKRIPAGCCMIRSLAGCFVKKIEDKCGEDAINFMTEVLNTVAAHLPEAICTDFKPDSPKCEGLLPDPNAPPSTEQSSSILVRLLSAYLGS